ncbi:hypothetical protein [Paludibacterium yongneupense]|uniref:hypothetical protein n=1 Tax=Paludibacterium yongneupense TaxID=400061 RepID=UPI00040B9FF6|nr:hypothetical protein [Paludibacterium yongneupense]
MATNYNLHLINESDSPQLFWLFLQPPEELASDPDVYANSSVSLLVKPNTSGSNIFTVPVQYMVGAGASNKAVGLGIKVTSDTTQQAELQQVFDATYYDTPPNQGPDLELAAGAAPKNMISIVTNAYEKAHNENDGWYSNQSFGIETEAGYIGMSWSPAPNKKRTLTPKLAFYVSIGSYGSNRLADWTDVSNDAATILVPKDFDHLDCTVTYTSNGTWVVSKGKPENRVSAQSQDLLSSHLSLCRAHERLVASSLDSASIAPLADGQTQVDTLTEVVWNNDENRLIADTGLNFITGTISVQTALLASFAFFVINGIDFKITKNTKGQSSVSFSYSGTRSLAEIKKLFVKGVTLLFKNK